jgi:hypothetical protein
LRLLPVLLLFWLGPVLALTPAAKEFVAILKQLEPVHCEKMKLRRDIALAEVERRDADAAGMKKRFAEINRDPTTAKLEKRLAELEHLISDGRGGARDPQDLDAISFQRRQAFYQCE